MLTALQNCLCEYRHGADRVGENYKIYVETKLANAYCHGGYYAKGLKIYRDAFKQYEDLLLRNRYHPLMFSVVAMLNENYDEAKRMMDAHLLSLLQQTPEDSFNFDIERNYAVLYMYKGDLKKAGKYIQRGQRWDKTKFNFLGDVLQRVVNNIYYLLLNDLDTSLSLARKNIRFLNSKPQDGITEEYKIPFLVIQEIIRRKQGKKTSQQFNHRLQGLQQGLMKLYGSLLLKANKS